MTDRIEAILNTLSTNKNKRTTAFIIGNTSDEFPKGTFYEIPVRETNDLIYGGVIVRDVATARRIAKLVDGRVDHVFVDDEKKIRKEYYGKNDVGNIQKPVSAIIEKSNLIAYKGNDLAVDTTDALIGGLLKQVNGSTVAIIGMGNLGSKLALRLVERGVHVRGYRRDGKKLTTIVNGINAMKSPYTQAQAIAVKSIKSACVGADVIIGTSNEKGIIDTASLKDAKVQAILIDAGKGCFADEVTKDTSRLIYRIDVSLLQKYTFYGLIRIREHFNRPIGRKYIPELDVTLISLGLFAGKNEVIVDDIDHPRSVIGVSAGDGTLARIEKDVAEQVDQVKKHFKIK